MPNEVNNVWKVHHLGVIGEAANHLSVSAKDRSPEIPWRKVVGLRNLIVHVYFGVDMTIINLIISDELPALKLTCRRLLRDLEPTDE